MKKSIFLYAIIVALTGSCATQTTKEYVDKRDAATLADSKDYTDVQVAELARDLPTKDTLKPLVEDIIKTNIYPWAREETKPTYSPEEIGALPDTTVIPTKVSDIDNDLEFIQKSVFDTAIDGKMSMTNSSGSAYIGWMTPNIFFGRGSFVFGKDCEVEQYYCFASGEGTKALGKNSHSEGKNTTASGNYSHAEGYGTTASGNYSKASGSGTTSSGLSTHAEGYNTHAEGDSTHAEGHSTHAEGYSTHAEGFYTHASTFASKAAGINSQATNRTSFVWQGTDIGDDSYIDHNAVPPYGSHGPGTFNLNPALGIEGFYVGEKNLKTIITEVAPGGGGGGGVSEGRVGEIATNVVRECSLGGIWDTELQVWWTPVMSNGKLTYQATTNVNLNAEN